VTAGGSVLLTDFMPLRGANSDVIRRVTGLQGRVSTARGARAGDQTAFSCC